MRALLAVLWVYTQQVVRYPTKSRAAYSLIVELVKTALIEEYVVGDELVGTVGMYSLVPARESAKLVCLCGSEQSIGGDEPQHVLRYHCPQCEGVLDELSLPVYPRRFHEVLTVVSEQVYIRVGKRVKVSRLETELANIIVRSNRYGS